MFISGITVEIPEQDGSKEIAVRTVMPLDWAKYQEMLSGFVMDDGSVPVSFASTGHKDTFAISIGTENGGSSCGDLESGTTFGFIVNTETLVELRKVIDFCITAGAARKE